MTDSKTELYRQAEDWLNFAKQRKARGDHAGENVALYQLKVVVKELRKAVADDR